MQFLLAPIYLVGAAASGARPGPDWIAPFILVHAGLYGGATVFNSYYDRDHGPIAFQKRPAPVTRTNCAAALVLEAGSVAALGALSRAAGAVALAMAAAGVAYSHPRWRWKRSVAGSLAAVALGQGAGAFALGFFLAGRGGRAAASGSALAVGPLAGRELLLAAGGVMLITVGLYPITQVYQADEDRRRGDATLATRFGWRRALVLSWAGVTAGCLLLGEGLADRLTLAWNAGLAIAPAAFGLLLVIWARRFPEQNPYTNHDWAMSLCGAGSFFFLALAVLGLGHAMGPGR